MYVSLFTRPHAQMKLSFALSDGFSSLLNMLDIARELTVPFRYNDFNVNEKHSKVHGTRIFVSGT